MKILAIGTAALAIIAAKPAIADGFPQPTPEYTPPAAYSWTGVYVGANGGYGWGSVQDGSDSLSASGAIAGGQIGFNWQTGNLVVGLEGDYQWSGQKVQETIGCGFLCTLTEKAGVDYFGTGRVRLGFASNRALLYVTGGAAWTHISFSLDGNLGGLSANLLSASGSGVGWVAGGGFEMAVVGNLTGKIEYLFIDAPSMKLTSGGVTSTSIDLKDSIVRIGLNYRFGY
jgi:outer membrane immunogenic protein